MGGVLGVLCCPVNTRVTKLVIHCPDNRSCSSDTSNTALSVLSHWMLGLWEVQHGSHTLSSGHNNILVGGHPRNPDRFRQQRKGLDSLILGMQI